MLEEAVEIGLGIVFDLDAAPLVRQFDDANSCPEGALQFIDSGTDIGVLGGFAARAATMARAMSIRIFS